MSLFESLGIATRGVAASQMGISVTGQNISNANTDGYTRKRVVLTADYRKDGAFGQMGLGVDASTVERVRNQFLDRQINFQQSWVGYNTEMDLALERLENTFTEPSDSGLNTMLDQFWNSWQDLANNPSDASSREALAATTEQLTDTMQFLSRELGDFRTAQNDAIENTVTVVNNLTKRIAELNSVIAVAESQIGKNANDSRDERDRLVTQLANHVPVDWFEDERGNVTVTTNGNIIVGPDTNQELELYRTTDFNTDGVEISEVRVRYSNSKNDYMPTNGTLRGLLDVRDEMIPSYIQALDDIAVGLVREVNALHQTGYNLDGDTGVDFFHTEGTTAATIRLAGSIQESVNKIAAGVGGNLLQPPGGSVTFAVPAAGAWAGTLYDLDLKTINPQYNNIAQQSVQLTMQPAGTVLNEGPTADYVVDYNTGMVRINNPLRFPVGSNVQVEFTYNDQGPGGVGDGENALAIAGLRGKATMKANAAGEYTNTVEEFFSSMIGRLGIDRNEASTSLDTRKSIVLQLTNQQSEISGVSLDEEMSDMIRFEHTFQASARYLGTVNDMLDILLNI